LTLPPTAGRPGPDQRRRELSSCSAVRLVNHHHDLKLEMLRAHLGRMAEAGDPAEKFTFALEQPGMISVAKPGRGLDQRVEHGLQIEGRAADDLEYVGGRCLLLTRFLQFACEPNDLILVGI
jgi:hypothetical protein